MTATLYFVRMTSHCIQADSSLAAMTQRAMKDSLEGHQVSTSSFTFAPSLSSFVAGPFSHESAELIVKDA